ncbi:MAG: right-handed parallel beta-helix repeat-containing protein [bacterium]
MGALVVCLLLAACSGDKPNNPQYDYLHVPAEYATIQMAIDSSATGDTILIAPGIYTGEGNVDIWIRYRSVILKGETEGQTTIDCEHAAKFMTVTGAGSEGPVFIDLTITNGSAYSGQLISNHAGGALYCSESSPVFRGCRFEDCGAGIGGAVMLSDIVSNRTTGLFVDCDFESDSAATGGTLALSRAAATVTNCRFVSNYSSSEGGAIRLDYADLTLRDCLFTDNVAVKGADIYIFESDVEIEGCTMYQAQGGGTLYFDGGTASVTRSMIVGSTSVLAGQSTQVPTFSCSVLWQNLSGDWTGSIADQLGVDGNFSADPKFIDPENGDFFIHHDSPCAAHANECGVLIGAYPISDVVE